MIVVHHCDDVPVEVSYSQFGAFHVGKLGESIALRLARLSVVHQSKVNDRTRL